VRHYLPPLLAFLSTYWGAVIPATRLFGQGAACRRSFGILSYFRDRESAADLSNKQVGNFSMPWYRFHGTRAGIHPERMGTAFPLQDTAMVSQVPQESGSLHERLTTS